MKSFLLSIVLFSSLAYSDQAPSWWSLPSKGKNCTMNSTFRPKVDCGEKGYEVWTCTLPAQNDFTPATSNNYLIIGEFKSDTVNECSPTFIVQKVIQQN